MYSYSCSMCFACLQIHYTSGIQYFEYVREDKCVQTLCCMYSANFCICNQQGIEGREYSSSSFFRSVHSFSAFSRTLFLISPNGFAAVLMTPFQKESYHAHRIVQDLGLLGQNLIKSTFKQEGAVQSPLPAAKMHIISFVRLMKCPTKYISFQPHFHFLYQSTPSNFHLTFPNINLTPSKTRHHKHIISNQPHNRNQKCNHSHPSSSSSSPQSQSPTRTPTSLHNP